MNYDWDFAVLDQYWSAIFRGLLVTLQLSGLTIALGTVFGFLLGVVLTTRLLPLQRMLLLLVDVIRSTPVLILILTANYYLPVLVGNADMSPFSIALVSLSVNLTAFIGDVVRGAIKQVPQEEIDAARAAGFSRPRVLGRFVLPRVARMLLPTLTLLYIAIAKHSALASVIAVYDLTHTANLIIVEQMRTLEIYAVVMGLYVALILPFTLLSRRLETPAGSTQAVF